MAAADPARRREIAGMGGRAAAKSMTREAKTERARLAAKARWQKEGRWLRSSIDGLPPPTPKQQAEG